MTPRELLQRVRSSTAASPGTRRWAEAMAAVVRETSALVRQTPLMGMDLGWRALEPGHAGSDLVVVLHGLFATAGALRPLRRAVERSSGAQTVSFTYGPGCDVRTLAARLASMLSDAPSSARIQLVGHSLGGIVARYYVQVQPCDRRIVQTISLGSPFAGTRMATIVPRFIARDVAEGSAVLRRIERRWRDGEHVPHTSIVASHDQMVVPSWSAAYPHGDVVIAIGRGHNALLFDPEIARLVGETVQRGRQSSCETSALPSGPRSPRCRLIILPHGPRVANADPTSLLMAAG